MLKRLILDEKKMLDDQPFQTQENERKADIKAEREEKKKEALKKKLGGFARRRSRTSAKSGTRNKGKSKRRKKA